MNRSLAQHENEVSPATFLKWDNTVVIVAKRNSSKRRESRSVITFCF